MATTINTDDLIRCLNDLQIADLSDDMKGLLKKIVEAVRGKFLPDEPTLIYAKDVRNLMGLIGELDHVDTDEAR